MKILTWNCNLKFRNKFELIESLNPDICVIQECENLKRDFFPSYKYFWTGENQLKGLGVLTKDKNSYVDASHNKKLINFLPIISSNLLVLGVWAYNHRAIKFGEGFNGKTIDALDFYRSWLEKSKQSVVVGDFNNSVIWDKSNNRNNFFKINSELNKVGFKSAYHKYNNEKFGQETKGTFFHTKKESKKYHIDYIYTKQFKCDSLSVGSYSDWIDYSDHVPLVANLK